MFKKIKKRNGNIVKFNSWKISNALSKAGESTAEFDKIIAENLFKKLNNYAVGSSIFIDIPEVNREAFELVNKYKMKPMFETARMYTKRMPIIDLNKVFSVTTFELG